MKCDYKIILPWGGLNMGKIIGMCMVVLFFSMQIVKLTTSDCRAWWYSGASVILVILLIIWVVARFAEE
jgi:hypothetical protein